MINRGIALHSVFLVLSLAVPSLRTRMHRPDPISHPGRLSDEMEIAIFRMVQECLTNIHRHSGGTSAVIHVHEEDHDLFIEVQDRGKGISQEKQSELSSSSRTGVGFRGMRECLRRRGSGDSI